MRLSLRVGSGPRTPSHFSLTSALAAGQLISWGAFYYALPVFVTPISIDLGWNRELLFLGLSTALMTAVLVAPIAGNMIDQGRGRTALLGGQAIGTACLGLLPLVQQPLLFFLLCCGIGIGQGACLYDTAFSILHRRLGNLAPGAIMRVTLVAGFAGTVFVPAAQYLVDGFGWRIAALLVAASSLVPLVLYALFVGSQESEKRETGCSRPDFDSLARIEWTPAMVAMIVAFAASTATFATITIHFLPLMIERGHSGFEAAKIFAVIGPAQIIARVVIWMIPPRSPALRWGLAVFALQAASIAILAFTGGNVWLVLFAIIFGASSGLLTIVRGNAPAEICARAAIGRLNGAIGAVAGLSRAVVPAAFAFALVSVGQGASLALLFAISAIGSAAFIHARVAAARIAPASTAP